jgi:hypothetical protein
MTDEPFRVVRTGELRRLEMCERGLAEAYRWHARRRDGEEARALGQIATGCDDNARLLRVRLVALGGLPEEAIDASWLVAGTLAAAEALAVSTYHDHLGDHDAETLALFCERILPRHSSALAYFGDDAQAAQP